MFSNPKNRWGGSLASSLLAMLSVSFREQWHWVLVQEAKLRSFLIRLLLKCGHCPWVELAVCAAFC